MSASCNDHALAVQQHENGVQANTLPRSPQQLVVTKAFSAPLSRRRNEIARRKPGDS
jgi:hypothetical protein